MDQRVNDIAASLGPGISVRVGPGLFAGPRARSSGIPALDGLLPGGGYPLGGAVEILGTLDGGRGHLALRAVVAQAREGRVAWAAAEGALDPWLYQRLGGDLARLSLVQMPRPERYAWAVEQVLRSGLFRMVVVQGTGPRSGRLLFDPAVWRRWSAAAGKGETAFLLLLEDLPALAAFARPARLRLRVWRGGDGRISVKLERVAGRPPGACLVLDQEAP